MAPPNNPAAGGKQAGANLSGITVTKEANFSQWYAEVVTKCELVEYYTEVCDILRLPHPHPLPLRRETCGGGFKGWAGDRGNRGRVLL